MRRYHCSIKAISSHYQLQVSKSTTPVTRKLPQCSFHIHQTEQHPTSINQAYTPALIQLQIPNTTLISLALPSLQQQYHSQTPFFILQLQNKEHFVIEQLRHLLWNLF